MKTLAHKIAYEKGIRANSLSLWEKTGKDSHVALMLGEDNKLLLPEMYSDEYKDPEGKFKQVQTPIKGRIIVDPWLKGIYRAEDWIKMVKELYPAANIAEIGFDLGIYNIYDKDIISK